MRASLHTINRQLIAAVFSLVFLVDSSPAAGQVPLPLGIDRYIAGLNLDQDVVVNVGEINAISVSGTVTLTFVSYSSGPNLDEVVDATTSYNVTVNGSSKKITASLDAEYSAGISVSLLLAPPGAGTSTEKTLSTTAQDMVVGFEKIAVSSLSITYTASASITAVPNGSGELRTVTLTITDN